MNYGKKSTQKREKELTSKSTMIRKKFYVIFCKSLLVCVFAVMVIGACSGVGVIRGIIASAPTIDDIVASYRFLIHGFRCKWQPDCHIGCIGF